MRGWWRPESSPRAPVCSPGCRRPFAVHPFGNSAGGQRRRLRLVAMPSGLRRSRAARSVCLDVDEPETNLSTERIYMRTHGEPLAGIHPTPPALLGRVEIEASEARQISENSCKANKGSRRTRLVLLMQHRDCRCAWSARARVETRFDVLLRSLL